MARPHRPAAACCASSTRSLRRCAPAAATPRAGRCAAASPRTAPGRPRRWRHAVDGRAQALLVDDSEVALRFLAARGCSAWGMRSVTAATSAEALELLAQQRYDFVFVDVELGDGERARRPGAVPAHQAPRASPAQAVGRSMVSAHHGRARPRARRAGRLPTPTSASRSMTWSWRAWSPACRARGPAARGAGGPLGGAAAAGDEPGPRPGARRPLRRAEARTPARLAGRAARTLSAPRAAPRRRSARRRRAAAA
ncbi:MAG: hypothetical protein MZW92_19525 [Comamonadaceae bacterium]|nr:hypothetical protein [Comamonadaceae bacterium]